MKIITVVTDKKQECFAKQFRPSCKYNRLALKVLTYRNSYSSHRIRDMLLYNYLRKLDKNDIILFTDSYDAFMLAAENEIIKKFESFESPLVFSAEISCWPDVSLKSQYPPTTTKLKYLNGGGFIGKCGYIADLIEKYYTSDLINLTAFPWSNQHVWHQIYLKENFKLDLNGEIFYTLCSTVEISKDFINCHDEASKLQIVEDEKRRILDELVLEGDRVKYKMTGSYPCQIHFNSPAVKELIFSEIFATITPWYSHKISTINIQAK